MLSTTGRRSLSYAFSASAIVSFSIMQAANEIAPSIASLVPEPIAKCAVAAESPIMTKFSCTHVSFLIAAKLRHLLLFRNAGFPPRNSAKIFSHISIDLSSLSPMGKFAASSWKASNPARRQISSCISTMKVLRLSSIGYACACITPHGVSTMKNLNAS